MKYALFSRKIEELSQQAMTIAKEITFPEKEIGIEELRASLARMSQIEPLRVTLTGRYNAGKSTLIRCLTGGEVKIDSDITTTEVSEHPWHGILFCDTPGVRSGEQAHDLITYRGIMQSDLIIFVITNELFDPPLRDYFLQLASTRKQDKAMMLVVNKMSRSTAAPEIVAQGVAQAILPYEIDQFMPVFTDGKRYLLSFSTKESERQQNFRQQSNIDGLVEKLNLFIQERGWLGRLSSTLAVLLDFLRLGRELLKANDDTSQQVITYVERQRRIFTEAKRRLAERVRVETMELRGQIVPLSQEIILHLEGNASEQVIRHCYEEQLFSANQIAENVSGRISKIIEDEYEQILRLFQELGESKYAQAIQFQLEYLHANHPNLDEISLEKKDVILNNAPKILKGLGNLLKNYSKSLNDGIYSAGKLLGFKFKPWGAAGPVAKIAKAAPWLAFVGAVIDIGLEVKEAVEEEQVAQKRRKARAEIRETFTVLAEDLKKSIDAAMSQVYRELCDEHIETLNKEAKEFQDKEQVHRETVQKLESLFEKAESLHKELVLADSI